LYAKGNGVPQDYAEAMTWYRKAADQSYAGAQFNLGVLYANGNGVQQDYVAALMWLNLAAAQGDETAINGRDFIAAKMTPDQIAAAQRLTREWKPTPHP
jgi:TPR repeat protein